MLKSSPNGNQKNMLYPDLLDQLNPKSPLLQLAKNIPWNYFEDEFAVLYSHKGKPAKPIRLMVGLSILKHLENLSDEQLIAKWVQNPYYQAFCGEVEFQWKIPCDPSEMTYFRRRIGEAGFEKILAVSIKLHVAENPVEEDIHADTTVQEKQVTYPTDDKLYLKIIIKALKLAKVHGIKLRRSYVKEIKAKRLALRFRQHIKNRKKVNKAVQRLKTIAGILLRELTRKLPEEVLNKEQEHFALYSRVLKQKRKDKNKIYSLHEPHIYCMAKGKLSKVYEFGTKASIAKTTETNIIVGALAFKQNDYDGHTLPAVLTQIKRLSGLIPNKVWTDRGYRGRHRINETKVMYPKAVCGQTPKKMKEYLQKQFRKRAGIEGVIGHLKSDHRLCRNYLKGFIGDQINILMAAAAFNFRKWLRMIIFWLQFVLANMISNYQPEAVVA